MGVIFEGGPNITALEPYRIMHWLPLRPTFGVIGITMNKLKINKIREQVEGIY